MDSRFTTKTFSGFGAIFLLTEPGEAKEFRANLALPAGQEFAVTRGEVLPRDPVSAKWMMGQSTPSDVVWTGFAAPVIISDRVVSILKSAGFAGWDTYRVEMFGKSGEPIAGYQGLIV